MKYAGQKKVARDIERKVKKDTSKADAKKRKWQKIFYYAKLKVSNQTK